MYFRQPLLLICILLILTERVQYSQSAKGPGISCSYANYRESYCKWPAFLVSDIPAECTSVNFLVALINENYCIGPGNSGSDYAILDSLLESDKDVYLYYGRPTQPDWTDMLNNASSNALREMESLKEFFEKHQGIAGLILVAVHYALCELPSNETSNWCSDTIATYNEKGQFAKEYGAGLMPRYVNFEDKNNTCECEKTFFALKALLDGFNGITSKPCDLFDNRNH